MIFSHVSYSFLPRQQSLEHLSWLGFFKENKAAALGTNLVVGDKGPRKEKNQRVFAEFKKHMVVAVSEETRQYLKTPTFNNWNFEDHEMLLLLQQMFVDLDLTTQFAIKVLTLSGLRVSYKSLYNGFPICSRRRYRSICSRSTRTTTMCPSTTSATRLLLLRW